MKDIVCIYLIASCVINIIAIKDSDPEEKIMTMMVRIILGPILMIIGIGAAIRSRVKK